MQLDEIRKEGEDQRAALREHVETTGPALNYKKVEQVWDNYYKTMFTLKTVSLNLRKAGSDASELITKVSRRDGSAGQV